MYLGAIILGTGGGCFIVFGVNSLLDGVSNGWAGIIGGIMAFIFAGIMALFGYRNAKDDKRTKQNPD